MAFDSTISGQNSNSYISVADADNYHAGVIDSTIWDALTINKKERALIQATNVIENSYEFAGNRTIFTQRLKFPRNNISVDDVFLDGFTMPKQLIDATAEMAKRLIVKDSTVDIRSDAIHKVAIGSLKVDFKKDSEQLTKIISDMVTLFLSPLIETKNNSAMIGFLR